MSRAWWFPGLAALLIGGRIFGSRATWSREVERSDDGLKWRVSVDLPRTQTLVVAGGLLAWGYMFRRHRA